MRITTIAGMSALALGLLTCSGAIAAMSSADALSGTPAATTTCAQFTQMSPSARADFVKQIDAASPPTSLTSNSGAGSTSADADGTTKGALGLNTPLTGGQLISACEGEPSTSTLQDAFSHAYSGK